MKVQGVSRDSLPWRAPWQPYAAWYGFVGSVIITLVAGFPVFLKGNWSTSDFIASYIGIPIFIVPIIVWKLVHKTKVSSASVIRTSIFLMNPDSNSSLPVPTRLIFGLDVCRRGSRRSSPSQRRSGAALWTGSYRETQYSEHSASLLNDRVRNKSILKFYLVRYPKNVAKVRDCILFLL